MIEQYLPQTNESATVPKTFQFSELNEALDQLKNFQDFSSYWILRHIYRVLNINKNKN